MLSGGKDDRSKVTAEFVVIDGKGVSLRGRETSERLGILRVGLPSNVVGSLSEKPEDNEKYNSLCSGLGKPKGRKITLHVKHNVKPVIQAARRILLSLRSKIKEKIAELEALDITGFCRMAYFICWPYSGIATAKQFRHAVVHGPATSK